MRTGYRPTSSVHPLSVRSHGAHGFREKVYGTAGHNRRGQRPHERPERETHLEGERREYQTKHHRRVRHNADPFECRWAVTVEESRFVFLHLTI